MSLLLHAQVEAWEGTKKRALYAEQQNFNFNLQTMKVIKKCKAKGKLEQKSE